MPKTLPGINMTTNQDLQELQLSNLLAPNKMMNVETEGRIKTIQLYDDNRDGQFKSGYPLTISAETGIRIRWRWRVSVVESKVSPRSFLDCSTPLRSLFPV
jgi:hypothetical protein